MKELPVFKLSVLQMTSPPKFYKRYFRLVPNIAYVDKISARVADLISAQPVTQPPHFMHLTSVPNNVCLSNLRSLLLRYNV